MNDLQFMNLEPGDIIRHETGSGYIVTDNSRREEGIITVIRTINASNPIEWTLVKKGVPFVINKNSKK